METFVRIEVKLLVDGTILKADIVASGVGVACKQKCPSGCAKPIRLANLLFATGDLLLSGNGSGVTSNQRYHSYKTANLNGLPAGGLAAHLKCQLTRVVVAPGKLGEKSHCSRVPKGEKYHHEYI